jgi:hypothetical protein
MYKDFFWVIENWLCSGQWFVFLVFDPLFFWGWGGHNFLIFHPFLTIFSASDAPIGGVQVLFRHQKQRSPPLPLDPACPKHISEPLMGYLTIPLQYFPLNLPFALLFSTCCVLHP